MKKILLALCLATIVRAAPVTTTLSEDVKMELTKGKGSIVLKAGTVVEVVSKEGDSIAVIYRSLLGRVPANKTDFKGEVAKPATKPVAEAKPEPAPPAAKPTEPKPAEAKPAAPASGPSSTYGKMVKKARDNEAKHKENLVEPTDTVTGGRQKE